MSQNTKQIQIMSKGEAEKLVNRNQARYLRRTTFVQEEILGNSNAQSSALEQTALQAFAHSQRADILVEVVNRPRCGNTSDYSNKVYDLYKTF